jgi:hypothetical protein
MNSSRSHFRTIAVPALPATPVRVVALACLLAFGGVEAAQDINRTVVRGDTLFAIARDMLRNENDWATLQQLNHVQDPRRLRIGTVLHIPLAMIRKEPMTARVSAVSGDVKSGDQALTVGASVQRGTRLSTGEQSFATVELVDGSRLVLQPSSRLKVEELSRYRKTTLPDTRLRLEVGRIESVVTKMAAPRPQYTVVTPTATIGVRGTQFRVGTDDAGTTSLTEVTDGTVVVSDRRSKGKVVTVPAGYGLVSNAEGTAVPVTLLPAPDVSGLPAVQQRTIVRLAVPPIAGADRYRFQVGSAADMRNVVAENTGSQPEAKFADLADGDYLLRVRGIDGRGLEGRDAQLAFKLKARPEAPFAVSPVNGSKLSGESTELTWALNADAAHYRVQVATDATFAQPVADIDGVDGTTVMPAKKLPPGTYYWRARSIRADGDLGPWGDALRFVLKAPPTDPEPPRLASDSIDFAWSGEPGQTYLFQFARDAKFTDMVAERRLDKPAITLARPAGGNYYMRVRATDPDGFVGPFTNPQQIEIPSQTQPWWLLLVLLPAVL